MAIIKIVDNSCDTDVALFNLCKYITRYDRTKGRVGGRGLNPVHAYEDIRMAQELWGKYDRRRAYHLMVSFDDMECIVSTEAEQIAFQVSSLFFPKYQVLYGVHTEQDHLHIHFAVSAVSLVDGTKLHLDFKILNALRASIETISREYKIEN